MFHVDRTADEVEYGRELRARAAEVEGAKEARRAEVEGGEVRRAHRSCRESALG